MIFYILYDGCFGERIELARCRIIYEVCVNVEHGENVDPLRKIEICRNQNLGNINYFLFSLN